jgi:hypothetical protein
MASYYNYPPADAPGSLQFQAKSFTVNPAAGTATIQVSRTLGSTGAVTVHYQTGDGTATAGVDYTAVSGTLTFAAADCCQSFTVPIIAAGDANATTINLSLNDPSGGATLALHGHNKRTPLGRL